MTSAPSTHSLISPLPLPLPPPLRLSGNRKFSPPSSVRFRPLSITAARSFNTCLSAPNLASFSLYEVLGIPMGASGLEIKAAYRRMARTCHPDVVTIGRKDSSADEFMKIHAAYCTLSDPEKRAQYDRRIFRLHRSQPSTVSATAGLEPVFSSFNSGYTCRNWETDQCW